MDATGFCVLVTESDGRIEYANDTVLKILGYQQATLLGRDVHQVIHGVALPEPHVCPLRDALRDLVPYFGRDQFVDAAGRFVPVSVSCTPIAREEERQAGAVLVFRDRSQEEALERQREEVFGLISHELRSPLTTLVGFSRRLSRALETGELDVGEEHGEEIKLLSEEAQRMRDIVTVLLDMVAMERGGADVIPEPLAPLHLIREEAERVQRHYPTAQIDIDGSSDIVVESDDRYVRRVIFNLIENAAKYSAPQPVIRISVGAANGGCLVTVSDCGPGIPLEAQPHIFERFYREEAVAGRRRGLGLGLYLSRRLVRRLGGQLTFQSAPGKGSEFYVWLPPECPEEERPRPASSFRF